MTQLVVGVAVLVAMATPGVRGRMDTVIRFSQEKGLFAQQVDFRPDHKDRGYVKNCGPGGGYFNISWFPKDVDPTRQISFFVGIVSPVFFDKGRVIGSLSYEGNPMLSFDKVVSCQDIQEAIAKNLPSTALHIDCPIKKGEKFEGFYVFPNTQQLMGYDGDYTFRGELKSAKGEQLLCIEIELTILAYG